jgi:hypothetical protein
VGESGAELLVYLYLSLFLSLSLTHCFFEDLNLDIYEYFIVLCVTYNMEELTILGCDLMMWLALGLLGPNQQFHNDFFKLFFLGHHGFVPRRTSNKVENKLVRSKVKKQNSANYDFDCSTPLNVMYKSLNF